MGMKIPDDVKLDSEQKRVADVLKQLAQDLERAQASSLRQKITDIFKLSSKPSIKGVYIHGSVGRGKTMLMDAFYHNLRYAKKERWHFHAFMMQVHDRLNAIRSTKLKGNDDQPIIMLAKELAERSQLLCFDEFQVTDIADAMILGRLFAKLFEAGVVVVATSNQHPDELYTGGLHRERFLPFISLLKEATKELELDGPVDYRRQLLAQHRRYFTPNTHDARHQMRNLFQELSGAETITTKIIESKGRQIQIPEVAGGMAMTDFKTLCEQPLGANDYLTLAHHFHTLFVENIPAMNEDMHNEAKRFMTLVDILYDQQINVVMSAETNPDNLYPQGKSSEAFKRTISRIIEMTGG